MKTSIRSATLNAFCLSILLALLSFGVSAQTSNTDGTTPAGLSPGAPAGSYSLNGFENVNLYNGNLNVGLPLLSFGGRGSAGYTVTLLVEQKWRVEQFAMAPPGQPQPLTPVGNWWGALKPGYGPGVMEGRRGGYGDWYEQTYCGSASDAANVYLDMLTRLTFTAADGTEYELLDLQTGGQPINLTSVPCGSNGNSRGKVFVTADGSAATFYSDTAISDYKWKPMGLNDQFRPSGYLWLRDGTRYRIDNGLVSWLHDRNGNRVTFAYSADRITSATDSLNRQVTFSYASGGTAYDQISFKGFGGQDRSIKIWKSAMGSVLRSGFALQTYAQLFPDFTGASSSTQFNPSKVSAVELPNGRTYQFRYNSYGEVARIELPTGGAMEYDWINANSILAEGVIYRRVSERRLYKDGSNLENKITYSNPGMDEVIEVKTFDSSGTVLAFSKHYHTGSALESMTSEFATPISYPLNLAEGREWQREVLSTNGATVLSRVQNSWAGNGTLGGRQVNPRLVQILQIIEPTGVNLISKQTFNHDQYNNQTDVYEYGFRSGGVDPLVRHTHTDYFTSSYDTLNPSSSNPDPSLTSHIRDLPWKVFTYDGAGTLRAKVENEYDNYVLDGTDCLHSFHCQLKARSNISGLDSQFTTSYTKRGNPTAVTSYLVSNGTVTGSIFSYLQYDVAGNVVRVLDPRSTLTNNIATTIEYDDRFGSPDDNEARSNSAPGQLAGLSSFAFSTKVINALGHTSYTQFDYYLGKPVNGENANGVVASGYFNDSLGRPTQIRRAVTTGDENQTTFAYDDVNRNLTISSDRDANNDNILVNKVLYDQLGRTIESRRYEGGSNYIAIQTQYDALGRAFKTSNPFRPWQSESAVWTTQAFDALGRVISVTTPDNAVVTSSYSGNSVTVTDQVGKARKSVADSLGRLIQVNEDPNGVNHQTTYLYDVLDNLVKVTQGSQQRFFMYDSLKRLIRARNPEQATLPSLNLSDPITSNSAWSSAYQYDVSGNLTQKTDARGVVSTYAYDALNRSTSIDYSDSTPDVFKQYDLAIKGIGRINQTWQGGSSTSATYIDSYNALGRPLVQRQRYETAGVWSSSYQTTRTYNRVGGVTSQVYPSGNSVTYTYDAAGRTSSFSGNLGDGGIRTYANNITYSSLGGPVRERFGTNIPLYQKSLYNIRGQLFDTRVSSVNDMWDWNRGRLILYYSSNHLWGQSGTDNNGNVRFAETWIPPENAALDQADTLSEQTYEYDTVNRLKSVAEARISVSSGWVWQQQFKQSYHYDQYGNRTIKTNPADTWGVGINNRGFEIEDTTNRLYSPGDIALTDSQRRIRYDAAGNQYKDTYTGYGNASFDAENRITTIQDTLGGSATYNYNADGQRTRRTVSNQETWQIFGFDGELLAEYPANGATASPQKEYGYRSGQLLITAGGVTSGLVGHWKLDENTGTSTADSSGSGNAGTLSAGAAWGTGQSGSAASLDGADDYVQVGAKSSLVMTNTASFSAWIYPTGPGSEPNIGGTIVNKEGEYEIVRFPNGTIQMAFANSNPGWNWINTGYVAPLNEWTHVAVTYSNGTVKTYANGNLVHTYNGSGSIGDVVTGMNDFRIGGRQEFSQNFQGRIDEVRVYNRTVTAGEVIELMGAPVSGLKGHWKLNENTGTSASDSSGSGNTGTLTSGAGWGAGQSGSAASLDGIDDYVQVGAQSSLAMTSTASFSAWIYPTGPGSMATYGGIIVSKEGEYEIARFTDGTIQWAFANSNPGWAWVNTGHVAPLNEWTHLTITYSYGTIKTYANGNLVHTYNGSGSIGDVVTGLNDFRIGSRQEFLQNFQGRIDDVRVYNRAITAGEVSSVVTAGAAVAINWLVSDHLGTPRMILDQTGTLASVKRHDYLPFGEELFAPAGGRTTGWGYASGDGIRQQFTSQERDSETGLDYFDARYFASIQGRFISVDPENAGADRYDPQSWNGYSYAGNAPLTFYDPTGLWKEVPCNSGRRMCWEAEKNDSIGSLAKLLGVNFDKLNRHFQRPNVDAGQVYDVSGFYRNNNTVIYRNVVQVFLVTEPPKPESQVYIIGAMRAVKQVNPDPRTKILFEAIALATIITLDYQMKQEWASYIPPPENLPAFPDAVRVKRKNNRVRWQDSDGNIYEWDYQHGRVEKYDKRGRHLGEFDPNTGEQTKPADPTRRTEP